MAISATGFAQVTIGGGVVNNTDVSLQFKDNENKGVVLPWVSTVANTPDDSYKGLPNSVEGTLIYDITDKKVKYRKDSQWFDLSVDATGAVDYSLQNNKTENEKAKVSIGTQDSGDTDGILVLKDDNKAMILPREVSPHLNIKNPTPGTIVYDTLKKQLAVYNGTVWSFWKATE
ncbi:MAG: hypothetical protein Q4G16_04500 [Cruoricaptor ignavus]|nr:hypothetical protein [Cruoricaptor ignavus]